MIRGWRPGRRISWTVWAGLLLLMQAVASLGMLRLLRRCSATSGRARAAGGLLLHVFTVPAGVWFAAGINQLPMQIALVFGLHAHLDYLRTRRWQSLVADPGVDPVRLAFYEKAVLLFGIYALVGTVLVQPGQLAERVSTACGTATGSGSWPTAGSPRRTWRSTWSTR